MLLDKKSWQQALDAAAQLWRNDDTEGALKTLDDALASDPSQPFLRIQKYYMERAVEYRKGIPRLGMHPRQPGDPMVSVIMATYNRNIWIRESIESVIDQKFTDWELIISNDGGGDETEKIASSYNESRIRYFWNGHYNKSRALNNGLRNARGKYIGVLDDDDIYYPEHLFNLVSVFNSNPDALVVYAGSIVAYQRRSDKGGYEIYKKKPAKTYDFDLETLARRPLFSTTSALIKREFFENRGGFNELLNSVEDWELWLRLSELGKFIRVGGESCEFRWREDGSNMTTDRNYQRAHYHNAIGVMQKCGVLDSESLRNWGGTSAIKALSNFIDSGSDIIDVIAIRKILDARKPYHYFENLANELAREGNADGELSALRAAIQAAPLEAKLWFKLLRRKWAWSV